MKIDQQIKMWFPEEKNLKPGITSHDVLLCWREASFKNKNSSWGKREYHLKEKIKSKDFIKDYKFSINSKYHLLFIITQFLWGKISGFAPQIRRKIPPRFFIIYFLYNQQWCNLWRTRLHKSNTFLCCQWYFEWSHSQ